LRCLKKKKKLLLRRAYETGGFFGPFRGGGVFCDLVGPPGQAGGLGGGKPGLCGEKGTLRLILLFFLFFPRTTDPVACRVCRPGAKGFFLNSKGKKGGPFCPPNQKKKGGAGGPFSRGGGGSIGIPGFFHIFFLPLLFLDFFGRGAAQKKNGHGFNLPEFASPRRWGGGEAPTFPRYPEPQHPGECAPKTFWAGHSPRERGGVRFPPHAGPQGCWAWQIFNSPAPISSPRVFPGCMTCF